MGGGQLILFLLLFVCSLGRELKLKSAIRREDVLPQLAWDPKTCYKRHQECCYRYKKCGHSCKTGYCSQKSVCVYTKWDKCFKWKSVNTCEERCYDKMCSHFECTPQTIAKENQYIDPKIHQQVYYPDGSDPPKVSPSARPSEMAGTSPSSSPYASKSPRPSASRAAISPSTSPLLGPRPTRSIQPDSSARPTRSDSGFPTGYTPPPMLADRPDRPPLDSLGSVPPRPTRKFFN